MDLWGSLGAFRDNVASMAEAMGVPSVRSLIIAKRSSTAETEYIEIVPKPSIVDATPRFTFAPDGTRVQIEVNDFDIKGISKVYSKSQLLGRGVYYIVDGDLVDGQVNGGVIADAIPGVAIKDQGNTWSITIRRRKTRETERT